MNKQEAIEKLKSKAKPHWLDEEIYGDSCIKSVELCMAIEIVNQIDEPEKPVVPQFVADWYEANKDDFENNLAILIEREIEDDNLRLWFGCDLNRDKPIETLVNMHQFGYRVDSERLYTTKLKFVDDEDFCYLNKNSSACEPNYSFVQKNDGAFFTRAELEELGVWGNPVFEIEEVEK